MSGVPGAGTIPGAAAGRGARGEARVQGPPPGPAFQGYLTSGPGPKPTPSIWDRTLPEVCGTSSSFPLLFWELKNAMGMSKPRCVRPSCGLAGWAQGAESAARLRPLCFGAGASLPNLILPRCVGSRGSPAEPRDITFFSLQLCLVRWCVREQLEPCKASRNSGNYY